MRSYIQTNTGITFMGDNGLPINIPADHSLYEEIVDAVMEDDEVAVEELIDRFLAVRKRISKADIEGVEHFAFDEKNQTITYKGVVVANQLAERILKERNYNKNIRHLLNLLANTIQNPNTRAQTDLFEWLVAGEMPITEDGCILAYKYLNHDFYDVHTGSVYQAPGMVVEMDRSLCDDNPENTCSSGLHFCSWSYLPHYASGRKLVMVKVNPRDIVAFPRDYNLSKARCCRYEIVRELDWDTAQTELKEAGAL